jgi:hypothetical protein
MQLINTPIRKNLLVGLAVGTGTLASGCGTPEPASLENANRGDVDYSKLDYSKLDYSKIEQMDQEICDPHNVPGKDLGVELVARLNSAITVATEKKLDKAVITTLVTERNAVIAGNNVFQQFGDILGW